MSVRAAGLGSPRNGLTELRRYTYRGTGEDILTPPPPRTAGARQEGQPGIPDRVLAALRSLGGEASTPEIRAIVEFDGGPAFNPNYLVQVLNSLARRDPPVVTAAGRESAGSGRAVRWQLTGAAMTAGSVAPARPARRPDTVPAAGRHCRKCGYRRTAQGHKNTCGGGT